MFPKIGGIYPQIIHFDRVFPWFSPSILGGKIPLFLVQHPYPYKYTKKNYPSRHMGDKAALKKNGANPKPEFGSFKIARSLLSSWWFQPIWKILYSQNGNLPQVGMKIKNIWNHN